MELKELQMALIVDERNPENLILRMENDNTIMDLAMTERTTEALRAVIEAVDVFRERFGVKTEVDKLNPNKNRRLTIVQRPAEERK
jgi:hypothetical protein